jgi:hypothetical protein
LPRMVDSGLLEGLDRNRVQKFLSREVIKRILAGDT